MKTNQELLDEANKIKFKIRPDGVLNNHAHNRYERGLWFIKNSIGVHGSEKYSYGKVLEHFVDSSIKVPITCSKHGDFYIRPGNHSNGQGCKKCASEALGAKMRLPLDSLITKAREVHGDFYDYSKVLYTSMNGKIVIVCPVHGEFTQRASSHISGNGCPACSNVKVPTTEEWAKKAQLVHKNLYDYSKVSYKSAFEKVEIICSLHGSFWQTPSSHLHFQGCPKCAGKNHNILYLLRCSDTGLHKIGITTDDVAKRMSGIGGNLEEIFHVVCEDPREHETYLHKQYKEFNVYHNRVNNGNTEFFSLNEEQVAKIRQYMASIAIK